MRVNITVDSETLEKAKKKLNLFGGKLSTLFDAYLRDFVKGIDKDFGEEQKALQDRLKDLEERIKKLEKSA
ncbi:MAG: hypothetical protein AABX11_01075 [Nanoarchaeota archaeon]